MGALFTSSYRRWRGGHCLVVELTSPRRGNESRDSEEIDAIGYSMGQFVAWLRKLVRSYEP